MIGWIHRTVLKKRNVEEMSGCDYIEINDNGLLITHNNVQKQLAVDTVVICAGQESLQTLYKPSMKHAKNVFMIGGAFEAGELDAKRAIDQGTRLAANIENSQTGDVYEPPEEFMPTMMKRYDNIMNTLAGKKKTIQ